jgi:tetratricopeptide (TPR) repeat protein
LGNHSEAIKYYDKALEINPTYIVSLNNKGVALSNLGNYQEALKWYDKALEQKPGDLDMIANKARILGLELDKYTDALKLISKYISKNPDHKGLLCNKAEILEKMGNTATALPIKDKLIRLYSDNYKCGYFTKTGIDDIVGELFVLK